MRGAIKHYWRYANISKDIWFHFLCKNITLDANRQLTIRNPVRTCLPELVTQLPLFPVTPVFQMPIMIPTITDALTEQKTRCQPTKPSGQQLVPLWIFVALAVKTRFAGERSDLDLLWSPIVDPETDRCQSTMGRSDSQPFGFISAHL